MSIFAQAATRLLRAMGCKTRELPCAGEARPFTRPAVAFAAFVCVLLGAASPAFAQQITSYGVTPTSFSTIGQQLTFAIHINTGSYADVNNVVVSGSSIGASYSCSGYGGQNSNITCTAIYTTKNSDAGGVSDSVTVTAYRSGGGSFEPLINGGEPTFNVSYTGAPPVLPTPTVLLTNSPSTSTHGQSVTLTATINHSGGATPTGSVEFYDDNPTANVAPTYGDLGPAPVSNGVATLHTTALSIGNGYQVEADYSGDSNYQQGNPGLAIQTVTAVAAASAPTIAAAFSPTTTTTAGTSTLTLTVSNPNGSTQLTGVAVAAAALPTNLNGAAPSTTCSSGTATFSSRALSLSGATLNASASCTVTLTVSSSTVGSYGYTTGAVSASGPSALSGTTATTPTSLTVNATAPGAPTIGSATGGNGQAGVTFTAPSSNGGSGILHYTATSSPGGVTGTGLSSPITVTGLTNGTAYTFTVTATNGVGTGASSAASNSVTPIGTQTITFNNPGAQSYGTAPTLTASATSGLTVTFSSSTTGVCTITSGGALTFITTGGCSINANQPGDAAYSVAPTVTQAFSVTAGTNTITFAQPSDTAFTATPPTLSATASSGVAPSFSSNSTGVCTVTSGGAISFVATGVCSITASQGPTGNYGAATSVTRTFSVTAGTNTITFAQPSDTAFTATPPTLSASASSGVAPSFSSNSTGVCTVTSGGAISFVATGVCSITASQGPTGNYGAATSVTRTFSVTAGTNTITFAQPSDTAFTATPPTLSASASSGVAPSFSSNSTGVCTVTSGGAISFVATGVCSITASQGPTGNYGAATSVTRTFSVTAGTNTITFAQPSDTAFTATPPTLSASASSGVAPSFSSNSTGVCTVTSGGAISFVATGVCSITASQGPTGNYGAATSVTRTFSVTAGTNTITFAQPSDTAFTATPPTLSASASSGVAPSFSSNSTGVCTVTSGGAISFVATGVCSITASQGPTGNYGAATSVTRTFSVTAGTNTITFAQPSDTAFTATPPTLSATASSGVAPSFSSNSTGVCTVTSGGAISFVATGVCSITASQGPTGNYGAATSVTRTFSVTAGTNTITFAQPSDTAFTATPPTLSATASSGLAVSYASTTAPVCTVTGAGSLTFVAAGTCSITASQAGNGNYAAATPVTRSFSVTAGVNAITFAQPANTAFTATPPTLGATASSGLAVSYASTTAPVCTVTNGGTITFVTAGTCSITASQAGNGNYAAATPVTRSFSVTAGTNAITFAQPANTAFTATPPTLGATASSGLAVSYASTTTPVCTVTNGGTITFVTAGTCSITASQAGNGNYAAATPVTRSFSVTAGVNAITFAQPANTAFTATPPTLGATASSGLAVSYASTTAPVCTVTNGGTITFVTAGTCSITASQSGNGNYAAATPVTQSFNVTAGTNVISFSQGPALLGSPPFALTGAASSGLAVSYASTSPTVCTVTAGGMVTLVGVGACSITASQAGNANYAAAAPVSVQFAVTANVPVAVNKAVTTAYNVAEPINLAASVTGVLNSANPLAVAKPPTHGAVAAAGEVITYTPAANYFGPDSFTYTATGPGGTSAAATVSITVSAPTLKITPATLAAGQQAVAYSQTLSASGGAAPYSFTLASGSLPTGLTLTGAGVLSGMPTTPGVFTFAITATDSSTGASPATVTKSYSLTIAGAPPPIVAPKTVTVTLSSTGVALLTVIDLSSSVQYASGISIVAQPAHGTATVSGFVITYTPNPGYFGTDAFQYAGIPLSGGSGSAGRTSAPIFAVGVSGSVATVTLTIPSPTVAITPASLPAGKGAAPYSQALTASGGTAPYTYAIAGGALPAGLILNGKSGVLSGTPTVSGTFAFSIKATDSSTGTGPFSAVQAYNLTIAALVPTAPNLTVAVPADKVGSANLTTGATGGPFTGAAVLSVSPAAAGTASIAQASGTAGVSAQYVMSFTPARHFSGAAVVSYTLSNSYATSAPGTVTFQIATRPDPTLDPDVRGLISDQTETALHFAEQQLDNFNQRLESLHREGGGGSHNSLAVNIGSGDPLPSPNENPVLEKGMLGDMAAFGIGPGYKGVGIEAGAASSPLATKAVYSQKSTLASATTSDGGDQPVGASGDDPFSYWIGGAVDFGLHEGDPTRSKFKFTTTGVSFGGDYRFTDRLTLGLGGGYSQNASKIGEDGTRDDAISYVVAGYGTYHLGEHVFLDGVLGYATLHYKSQRYVSDLGDFAFGHRSGDEAFGSITASYEYRAKPLVISPYLRFDVVDGTLDAFTETGSVQSLAYASQSVQALRSIIGAHGDYPIRLPGGLFTPRFRVEYQHDFEGSGAFRLQYADWLDGPVYSATADPIDHDRLVLGIGADVKSEGTTLSIDYKTTVDSETRIDSEILGKIKMAF